MKQTCYFYFNKFRRFTMQVAKYVRAYYTFIFFHETHREFQEFFFEVSDIRHTFYTKSIE